MKMLNPVRLLFLLLAIGNNVAAQDSAQYRLRLSAPLVDFPQNLNLPYRFPSMEQSLALSNGFYELANWGMDGLGDLIIDPQKSEKPSRKVVNRALKYGMGLAFSKYGSELPIPLGVWGHEEFHRSALGVKGIHAENGNWLLNRWDGTVYGVSDEEMSELKQNDPDGLLYAYVSGVQYEVALNERVTLGDFYHQRTLPNNALLLYNAHYVYNYFRFSTSPFTDSVKVIAPQFEDSDPSLRDFAGADLTAWVYDMFSPNAPYLQRDSFPNGEGVNRRIGFSELSPEGQAFLQKQKKLSLLNFLNPAIFFVNRIRISDNLALNAFAQYAPTHFGNEISLFIPVSIQQHDLLLGLHKFQSDQEGGFGLSMGVFNQRLGDKLRADARLDLWNQPRSFLGNEKDFGGKLEMKARYPIQSGLSAFAGVQAKTKGWVLGNPYLNNNFSVQAGLEFNLAQKSH